MSFNRVNQIIVLIHTQILRLKHRCKRASIQKLTLIINKLPKYDGVGKCFDQILLAPAGAREGEQLKFFLRNVRVFQVVLIHLVWTKIREKEVQKLLVLKAGCIVFWLHLVEEEHAFVVYEVEPWTDECTCFLYRLRH